jgi:hypothetical protein
VFDGPVISSAPNHDDFRVPATRPFPSIFEKRNGKPVPAAPQPGSPRDLVSGIGSAKKRLEVFWRRAAFPCITQQEQPGLMIVILPGMEKAVGSGKGGYVVVIEGIRG